MKRAPADRDGSNLTVLTIGHKDIKSVKPVNTDLESFLTPMPLDTFQKDYMQQGKALAIKVHPRLRDQRIAFIKKLLDDFNPSAMLENSNSEQISVWMKTNEGTLHQIKSSAEDAKKCYEAGHSLYFRGNESLESTLLPAYAQQLGFLFNKHRDGMRRSEIETFASQIGHTTDWHWDFQENFTIQLRGTKKWSILKSSVLNPHRAYAPHFNAAENSQLLHTQRNMHTLQDPAFQGLPSNADDICETVTLQPGDVLYHPPGIWHKVETIAAGYEPSNSLSINLSIFPMTWNDYLMESLQQQMVRNSLTRGRVMTTVADPTGEKAAQAVLKQLADDVQKLSKSTNFLVPKILTTPGASCPAVKVEADGSVRVHGGLEVPTLSKEELKSSTKYFINPLAAFTKCIEPFPTIVAKLDPSAMNGSGNHQKASSSDDDDEEGEWVETDDESMIEEGEKDDEVAVAEEESSCDGAMMDMDSDVEAEEITMEIAAPEGYIRYDYMANFVSEDCHDNAPAVKAPIFVHESREGDMNRVLAAVSNKKYQENGVQVKDLAVPPAVLGLLVFVGLFGR